MCEVYTNEMILYYMIQRHAVVCALYNIIPHYIII